MTEAVINFCKPSQGLSECEVQPSWAFQKECLYAKKSSAGAYCMHCRFDEFCDSPHAQQHARNGKGKTINFRE